MPRGGAAEGGPPGGGPLPPVPDGGPLTAARHPLPHRCPRAHGRRARARVRASGTTHGHGHAHGHADRHGHEHRHSHFAFRTAHVSRPLTREAAAPPSRAATACTRRRPSPRRARRYRFSNATGTAWRKRAHRGHRINRPGPIRPAPSCCIGNDEVAKTCPSAQRTTVRSIDSIKSLPQPHTDEKATLGDERDATAPGTPTPHATPPTPADHTPVHHPSLPARTTRRPHGASAGGLAWGRVWNDAAPVIGMLRGCSLMVEHELPKLRARVRFSSPAPR